MEERTKIHVGLDVHKDSITVAVADPGREKARLFGKVVHDVPRLLKVLAKIGAVEELHIVYEAGPTGSDCNVHWRARGMRARSSRPRRRLDNQATGSRPMPATAWHLRNTRVQAS